jgi:hypothetical protein
MHGKTDEPYGKINAGSLFGVTMLCSIRDLTLSGERQISARTVEYVQARRGEKEDLLVTFDFIEDRIWFRNARIEAHCDITDGVLTVPSVTVRRLPNEYYRTERIRQLESGKEWERELAGLFRNGAANYWLNQALGRKITLPPAKAKVTAVSVM